MLSEPAILMILPACLVFTGMVIGFVLWSWARGVDVRVVDELQDEIRRLGNIIRQNSNSQELTDLQFENEELKSMLRMQESEQEIAEQTIARLHEEIEQLKAAESTTIEQATTETQYKFVQTPVGKPVLNVHQEVSGQDSTQPEILKPVFETGAPCLDVEYGGEVTLDEKLGLVYTRPPLIQDNLRLISGIASVLEQQLNDYGVYTFQQIMLWNRENIDQFSNLLDTFQDRIQRDDWVGQARYFYNKQRQLRRAA